MKKFVCLFLVVVIACGTLMANDKPQEKMKENNAIMSDVPSDKLKDPEVIKYINEAYKRGFIDGSEEAKYIMVKRVKSMEKHMDQLFAFHKLYLEGKIQPPKIGVVSDPVQVIKNGKAMVIQQELLEIIEPAKFVDKPRTWKNFIVE